jgi:hypothetical protein
MLETSRVCRSALWASEMRAVMAAGLAALAACAAPEAARPPEPPAVVKAPEPAPPDANAQELEAKAMLVQAETDIQRARAKRALWLKAWESLVLARQSAAARDNAATVQHAKRASELAQLGLEQLAYPPVN